MPNEFLIFDYYRPAFTSISEAASELGLYRCLQAKMTKRGVMAFRFKTST